MTRARNIANRALSDITTPGTDQDITIDPNGIGDIMGVTGNLMELKKISDLNNTGVAFQLNNVPTGGETAQGNAYNSILSKSLNSVDAETTFHAILFYPSTRTDGSEHGEMQFKTMKSGSLAEWMDYRGVDDRLGINSEVRFFNCIKEARSNLGSSVSGAITIDCKAANWFYGTLTGNVTSITFTNTSGGANGVTLELTQGGSGGYTVNWPTTTPNVKWAGGTAPTLSTGVGDIDIIQLISKDGSNWYGFPAGLDMQV